MRGPVQGVHLLQAGNEPLFVAARERAGETRSGVVLPGGLVVFSSNTLIGSFLVEVFSVDYSVLTSEFGFRQRTIQV